MTSRRSRAPVSSTRGGSGRQDARGDRRGSVSRTERARTGHSGGSGAPSRRKAIRRRWVALLSVLVVLGAGYLVLLSPVLAVESVRVTGARTVPDQRVRAVASVDHGRPLIRVDTGAVRARVSTLPIFSEVEVSRSWPSTVVIDVTERKPVAVVDIGSRYRLVGADGVVFGAARAEPVKPSGLPELRIPDVGPNDPSTRAAIAVLMRIPDKLRKRVAAVTAETENSVHLKLADGTTVIWGSPERSARKAKVLSVLFSRPGTVYDVSSPELPTVS